MPDLWVMWYCCSCETLFPDGHVRSSRPLASSSISTGNPRPPDNHHHTEESVYAAQSITHGSPLISAAIESLKLTPPKPEASLPFEDWSSGPRVNESTPKFDHFRRDYLDNLDDSDDSGDDGEIETHCHAFGDDMCAKLPGQLTQTPGMIDRTLGLLLLQHRHWRTAAGGIGSSHTEAGRSAQGTTRSPSDNPRKRRRVSPGPTDTPEQEPPSHDVEHDQEIETLPEGDHLFACPFWKGDLTTWRDCFRYKLKRIRDVKLHLKRVHSRSFCVRCGNEFKGKQALDAHCAVTPPCASRRFLKRWLCEGQKEQLAKRSNPKFTIEQQWYAMWDIVYPARLRPDSPYINQSLSEDLNSFVEFFTTQGPRVMLEAGWVRHGDLESEHPHLLQMGLRRIYDQWTRLSSASAQPDPQPILLAFSAEPAESNTSSSGPGSPTPDASDEEVQPPTRAATTYAAISPPAATALAYGATAPHETTASYGNSMDFPNFDMEIGNSLTFQDEEIALWGVWDNQVAAPPGSELEAITLTSYEDTAPHDTENPPYDFDTGDSWTFQDGQIVFRDSQAAAPPGSEATTLTSNEAAAPHETMDPPYDFVTGASWTFHEQPGFQDGEAAAPHEAVILSFEGADPSFGIGGHWTFEEVEQPGFQDNEYCDIDFGAQLREFGLK
ncbi:hypothetical protein QBC39DRAFT_434442 [Podospora conica]|nr:hypothetical protein QBC39DRAFT_434442 [Schizothecium conicum]